MIMDEQAKTWIFGQCSKDGNPKTISTVKSGLNAKIVKETAEALKRLGCISYTGLVDSHNAGLSLIKVVFLKNC